MSDKRCRRQSVCFVSAAGAGLTFRQTHVLQLPPCCWSNQDTLPCLSSVVLQAGLHWPAITAWLPSLRAGRLEPPGVKAVFAEPGGDRGWGHAQQFDHAVLTGDFAPAGLQRLDQVAALLCLEFGLGQHRPVGGGGRCSAPAGLQIVKAQRVALGQDDLPFNDVFQFPDIAVQRKSASRSKSPATPIRRLSRVQIARPRARLAAASKWAST